MICVGCFAATNKLRILALASALTARTKPPTDFDGHHFMAVAQLHGESLCAGHLALELARSAGK